VPASLTSTTRNIGGDNQAVSDYLYAHGMTDGLPIVAPTPRRVMRALAATSRAADDVLGLVPPLDGVATVEKVAVNAVMAGCRPEYLPVLITATELMLRPEWQLAAIQPTTNPLTPLLLLNGPIRRRLDVNCATGAMGPGWKANATIGRAIRLLLMNLGGANPGTIDMCTQGFVGKYGLCFGENEEESPWPSYATEQGFDPDDSVVTVTAVNSSINIHDSSGECDDLLKTLRGSLASPGSVNIIDPHNTSMLALNPLHARILASHGYDKASLKEDLHARATLPADALSRRREHLRRAEGEDLYTVNGAIPLSNDASSLKVVVVGGMQGGHSCFLPNGHNGHALSARVSA
jgi:hypothetical protein